MRKKLLFSMVLAMLSVTMGFSQTRTQIFHEAFAENDSRGLIDLLSSSAYWPQFDNWAISYELRYNIFAVTKNGNNGNGPEISRDSTNISHVYYPGASGGCYSESRTWGTKYMAFNFVDTREYRNVWLEMGVVSKIDGLVIEYATDISRNWQVLEYTEDDLDIYVGEKNWSYVKIKKQLPSVLNLHIRLSTTASTNQQAIDDIRITGERDYGYDLRKDIPTAETLLLGAVEGKELGMFLGGKAALETALAAAKVVTAKGDAYTNEEAETASIALTAALNTFAGNKITTTNAPKIDKVNDQPYVFNNEPGKMTVNLSGLAATSGGGSLTVTATSKNGVCTIDPITGSGATRTLTYKSTTTFGKDVITVKVEQQNQPSGVITKVIEMSFGIEILNSAINYPPQINNVADQRNVSDESGKHTITITGLDAINAGQSITEITAASSKTAVVGNPTVTLAGDKKTATLEYTPVALASGTKNDKATITLTVKDNGADNNTSTFTFVIYTYNQDNPPAMFDAPAPEKAEIITGSSKTELILPNVQGSPKLSDFVINVLENPYLFKNAPVISYTANRKFATLDFENSGMEGTARVSVALGDYVQEFDVVFKKFYNPGIELSMYDAMMWQRVNVIAVGAGAIYSEVLKGSVGGTNYGKAEFPNFNTSWWGGDPNSDPNSKWWAIREKWTIDCVTGPGSACHAAPYINLGTLAMKGFFIPEESGTYEFSLTTNADFTVGLWFDVGCVSWKNAACIARAHSATDVPTGSVVDGNRVVSAKLSLEAGKAYPMYSVRWFTHQMNWNIDYRLNGGSWTTIPETLISPLCDLIKPEAPAGVKIHTTLNEKVLIEWNVASSGSKVAKIEGYNVYANGIQNNSALITDPSFLLEGLTAGTDYDIFVTSVDALGNESYASNVAITKTLTSSGKPEAPSELYCEAKTGEVLKMRWTPNIPGGIVAYDVSVNGETAAHVKNTDYIYTDSFFVRKLLPETKYSIRVRAYNGALEVSNWSAPIDVTTDVFDPLKVQEPGFNEHRVRLDINMRNISWTEGVGINASFKDGSLWKNADYKKAMDDLKPGIVRWGDLSANMYSLRQHTRKSGVDSVEYFNSIGSARKNRGAATHAMNMNYCNEIGAWYSLCIGTKQNGGWDVDYMHPTNGYKEFQILLEYLVGPVTSIGGALRMSEGISEPVLTKEKSKGVILEFGNEVWGQVSHNAPIGADYDAYGKWCRAMADSMRKSPYWHLAEDLILFKYSGRDPSVSTLNDNVVRGTLPGQVQILGVSGYLGGNLDYNPEVDYGESVSQYYRLRINHMAQNLLGMQAVMKKQISMINVPLNSYFYETQVSTSSYYGNLGQATVLLDYITASMKYGGLVPAIFVYGGGEWMINVGNRPLAHYTMARLVNTYCKGHLVESTVVTNNQVMVDVTTINVFTPISNFDPVGASVYNNGKNWSILLFSRDFDNEYSVSINLPEGIGTPKNVKRHIVTGDGSVDGPTLREGFTTIEDEAVSSLKSGDIVYVPPFSMVLYTFEANDPGFEALPLGYFDRTLPTNISFTGTPAITTNGGNTRLTAVVTPTDAFSTDVIWEISKDINKEIVAEGLPFPVLSIAASTVTVRATGGSGQNQTKACNGVFWLTATLADNPTVKSSIPITLTNQNSGCEYPILGVDGAESQVTVSVYPNPAEEALFVDTNTDALSTVTIYSSIGIRIMAETSSEQVVELNVASLPAGQYSAVVESNGKAETVTFLKK